MTFSKLHTDARSCGSDRDEALSDDFERVVSGLKIHNVFNPSFYCDDEVKIFAFRAINNGQSSLTSYISIEDSDGHTVREFSVDAYENVIAPRFIDPKVVKLGDEFHVTFNSGWSPEGNKIFIMKIYPEMESPRELLYENRQQYERNWAFFSEQGKVFALYWINPLKILELTARGENSWRLEDYYSAEDQDKNLLDELTIGTQLTRLNNSYHFVAHQKQLYEGKKVYRGRYCKFDFETMTVSTGKHWLVHSLKSMLGSPVKHNTNLFSCTYFSGIQAAGQSVTLGYGVNDVAYGFSRHDPDDL